MSSNTKEKNEKANSNLKYMSLAVLMFQNAILMLVMRYSRVRKGSMYISSTAVVMQELCKFLASIFFIFVEQGYSLKKLAKSLNEHIFQQPMDCVKVAVPAVVYMLQNNLIYVALSNLEAATFQVTYQLKILTTALFSVILLSKQLSKQQWISLCVLFAGVAIVQLQPHDTKISTKVTTEQNQLLGLIAVVVSCLMSGFAGVYFEKILKGTPASVWIRNAQLGFIGVIFGVITVLLNDGDKIHEKGFFYGYDWLVCTVIALQSFGGLLVAVVVKYADNILKGFATSGSIVISCILSVFLFDFDISLQFCFGAALVISSVMIYGRYGIVTKTLPILPIKT